MSIDAMIGHGMGRDRKLPRALHSMALVCMCNASFAQHERAANEFDHALAQAAHDSIRYNMLLSAAGELLGADPDSAMVLCERARSLAISTGRPSDLGEVEGWLGYVAEQRGRIDDALDHYNRSLAEIERLHDRKGASTVLNSLAAIYKDQGRLEESPAAIDKRIARALAS